MLSEKEKLEEELKLLEESFNLDVITKDEYENAKQRIEGKLNELEQKPEEKHEVEEETKKEEKKKLEVKEESIPKEEEIEIREIKEEVKQEVVKEEVPKEESKEEPVSEQKKEEDEITIDFSWLKNIFRKKEPIIEEKHGGEVKEGEEEQKKLGEVKETEEKAKVEVAEKKPAEEVEEEEKPVTVVEEEKKSSKKIFVYIAIIVILGFAGWYYYYTDSDLVISTDISTDIPSDNTISLIACSSDDDCEKEGSIGTCINPGIEDSKCEYVEDVRVKLTVLNDKSCFNCETGRVLSILNGFFPNIETENVDFETEEGKEVMDKYNINALPAYILNLSLQETRDYYKFYNAFNKIGNSFVMKNTVANANYYIEREEILNKLDVFLKPNQSASLKAEENLEEFWQAFDGFVILEKHDSDSEIVKELGINTFPAFLVNNKIKFSGVQAADKIRENFCQVNSVTPCALGLSKSLV